jgi:DNA polymerase-3 subunit epsilon
VKKVKRYAIIDIETTGGMYNRDKITEIAIVVTDGAQILDQYQTLVNPERSIPEHITRLTGIDSNMVRDAPKFYEIAKEVVEKTEGCIFVAHNVKFDYNFIKEEFRSLGYAYNKKQLCTVKLTRSVIPGLRSYGLDNLIRHFNLDVADRHRAFDDAYATYEIFVLLQQEMYDDHHIHTLINGGLDASVLPRGLDIEEVHKAPETPGVYYFINQYKQVVYVGKAKEIKSRIFQHFRALSRKSTNVYSRVHELNFAETGSELIALLLELHEIKTLHPEMNKAMKRNHHPYALYYDSKAKDGKPAFFINKNNKKFEENYSLIKLFSSKQAAENYVQYFIETEAVCLSRFHSKSAKFNCFCDNNCQRFFNQYNEDPEVLIRKIRNEFDNDFIILTEGREVNEKGFVMIHENRFWGFGYVPTEATIHTREEWNDYIEYQFFYPEANSIIKNHLAKHKCKVIKFE